MLQDSISLGLSKPMSCEFPERYARGRGRAPANHIGFVRGVSAVSRTTVQQLEKPIVYQHNQLNINTLKGDGSVSVAMIGASSSLSHESL